jgi:sugar phosphate isomerase/epimerase
MEIALCNEMLRPLPFSSQCDLAARLGYDALELAPFTLAAEPHRLGGAEVSDLRRLIRDTGLGWPDFTGSFSRHLDFRLRARMRRSDEPRSTCCSN